MEKLPVNGSTERLMIDRINGLIDGRLNAYGTVSLTPSTTTTTVSSPIFGSSAVVLLFPQTANAAAVVATTYAKITAGGGSFTITHANALSSDRTFSYVVLGG